MSYFFDRYPEMKFFGVHFLTREWQVVPHNWLTMQENKMKCHWPDKGDVEKLSRTAEQPKKTWGKWDVKKISANSGNS